MTSKVTELVSRASTVVRLAQIWSRNLLLHKGDSLNQPCRFARDFVGPKCGSIPATEHELKKSDLGIHFQNVFFLHDSQSLGLPESTVPSNMAVQGSWTLYMVVPLKRTFPETGNGSEPSLCRGSAQWKWTCLLSPGRGITKDLRSSLNLSPSHNIKS